MTEKKVDKKCRVIVEESLWKKAILETKWKLLDRLKEKGDGSYKSTHEVYGIIAEEFNKELLDALHKNDRGQFREELIDIAVACIFGIASMDAGGLDW